MHYLDYNEKKQHGTDDFPLEYYYINEQNLPNRMPFHWHKEIELIYILEGELRLYLDEQEYLATPGDLIYISEGVIHGGESSNCIYECLVFDLKPLLMNTHATRRTLRKVELNQIQINQHFNDSFPELLQCVKQLFSSVHKKIPGWELSVLGSLFEFYGIILQNEYYQPMDYINHTNGKLYHLKPVLEYIEANYPYPITLKTLSHIAGMSPKYFCRFFYAAIHRTPIDYLNYYRIDRACHLMETEDISISEAAYRCGFNDSNYFSRVFKKYKNYTPKQYMKHTLT